jgi:ribonuclease BN (tRNA processing enzyme)
VRFTVLGSGTALPDADRGPAGFLLQCDGTSESTALLIDGGTGTLQRLARIGVDARDLDGGVYSHRHVDHCGDLVPLLFALHVGGDKPRTRDYPIWAGEGFTAFHRGLVEVYGRWIQGSGWATPIIELPLGGRGEALLPGGIRLETRPANHSAGALHLRFTSPGGRSVVFSGDTGPSPALAELAAGADLLVTECALDDVDPRDAHLWPEAVAEIVAAARPGRVALTHLYPGTDPERALAIVGAAGAPVERARDLQVFAL